MNEVKKNEKAEAESTIKFIFDGIGSAEFRVMMDHIMPGQLFAAGAYLTWLAQQEAGRIAQVGKSLTEKEMDRVAALQKIQIPFQH